MSFTLRAINSLALPSIETFDSYSVQEDNASAVKKAGSLESYQILRKLFRERRPIYFEGKEEKFKIIGSGGSKMAILLSDCRALLIPNMCIDSINAIQARWERIVKEEIVMSQILSSIGLLCPTAQEVTLAVSQDPTVEPIPAYVCPSFEKLGKERGCFVVDIKNGKSSTWTFGRDFLFNRMADRLFPSNWHSVLDSLVTDIAKIHLFKIPVSMDSSNFAIVRKEAGGIAPGTCSAYEIRYFGFDFSSKHFRLYLPRLGESICDKPIPYEYELSKLLGDILEYMVPEELEAFFKDPTRDDEWNETTEKIRDEAYKKWEDGGGHTRIGQSCDLRFDLWWRFHREICLRINQMKLQYLEQTVQDAVVDNSPGPLFPGRVISLISSYTPIIQEIRDLRFLQLQDVIHNPLMILGRKITHVILEYTDIPQRDNFLKICAQGEVRTVLHQCFKDPNKTTYDAIEEILEAAGLELDLPD